MIKYIRIINYMCGDSIEKQIYAIEDAGLMDKDTRLFFDKHNTMTITVIARLMHDFEIVRDDYFDAENLVFKPKDYYLERMEADRND